MTKTDKVKIRYNKVTDERNSYMTMRINKETIDRFRMYFRQNKEMLIEKLDSFGIGSQKIFYFNSSSCLVRKFISIVDEIETTTRIQSYSGYSINVKKSKNGDYSVRIENHILAGVMLLNIIPENMFGIKWVINLNFGSSPLSIVDLVTTGEHTKIRKCIAISGVALESSQPFIVDNSHIFDLATAVYYNPRTDTYYYEVNDYMLDIMAIADIDIKLYHDVMTISDGSDGNIDGMGHIDFLSSIYLTVNGGFKNTHKTTVSIKE